MSCSYADGLSQYENKGVLGLEEVKIVYSLSLVWRESAIRDDFFNRSPARCVKTSVAFFFLSLLLPSPPAFLFSFLFLLFFFFSFYFFFLFFLQRYDSVETLRLKCGLLADWIQAARHVVVHTGAGISTAAGIPDFR